MVHVEHKMYFIVNATPAYNSQSYSVVYGVVYGVYSVVYGVVYGVYSMLV